MLIRKVKLKTQKIIVTICLIKKRNTNKKIKMANNNISHSNCMLIKFSPYLLINLIIVMKII